MQRIEKRLVRRGGGPSSWVRSRDYSVEFCGGGFDACVDIPEGKNSFYLVGTKKRRASGDSFTICKPGTRGRTWNDESTVTGIGRRHLITVTAELFARWYKRGFRYVHFEYDA